MHDGLLAGKRGLIFGVANEKSIAWACAKACADAGAEMIFSYAGPVLEARVRRCLDAELPDSPMFPCDVTKDDEIAEFFENVRSEWDSIDFVIHSVAFANREDLQRAFTDTSREGFALAMDVSAYSLVAIAREAAPMMSPGGSIVAMTYYGSEKVVPRYNVMGVAKAALEASARYLAFDLGVTGIRVNCVSAGPLRTLSGSGVRGMRTMLDIMEASSPLRRNITQDEVGKTTVYLLSDLSSAVTGETLHADCGYNTMGLSTSEPRVIEPPTCLRDEVFERE